MRNPKHIFGRSVAGSELHVFVMLCCGMAFLISVAVFLSGGGGFSLKSIVPNFSITSASAATAVTQTKQFDNATLTITADAGSVTSGGSANISWTAANVVGYVQAPTCFGNGLTGASAKCASAAGANAQNITAAGAIPSHPSVVQFGTDWFMALSSGQTQTGTTDYVEIYKWLPSLNCFGAGSTCGARVQDIALTKKDINPPRLFVTANNILILGFSIHDFSGCTGVGCPTDNVYIYQWNGSAFKNIYASNDLGSAGWGSPVFATINGVTYGLIGPYLKVWTGASFGANSGPIFSGGPMGQDVSGINRAGEIIYLQSSPVQLSANYTQPLLASTYAIATNKFVTSIYPWNPSLKCFGTTACWTALQTFPDFSGLAYLSGTGGNYNASASFGGNDYIALQRALNVPYNYRAYQWIPALNCYGQSGACNTSTSVTVLGMTTNAMYEPSVYIFDNKKITPAVFSNPSYGLDAYPIENGPVFRKTDSFFVGMYESGTIALWHGLYKPTYPTTPTAKSCTVSATNAAGTVTLATTLTGGPLSTGPLTQTTTYTLTCTGEGSVSVIITVSPPPTLTITATNVQTAASVSSGGTLNLTWGQSANIAATFAAAVGDTLIGDAINGPAPYTYANIPPSPAFQWNPAGGMSTTPKATPNDSKPYPFTPPAVGDYTFIPDALVASNPNQWYDNGQFVTVHVACATGASGSTCNICTPAMPSSPGYGLSGSSCVACVAGQTHAENNVCFPDTNTTSCGVLANGYYQSTWSDATAKYTCTPICTSPFVWGGSSCINQSSPKFGNLPSNISFKGGDVRKNTSATLTWSVGDATTPMNSGVSCSIAPANGLSGSMSSWGGGQTWSGSVKTTPITKPAIYTLTCQDTATAGTSPVNISVLVGLIPAFQEI